MYYGRKLLAPGEFPFCPQFTHFTADNLEMDRSVPSAFLKAAKDGKFPSLRRIELNEYTMNDCEWPQVPEFSCHLHTATMSDSSQIQKLLSKLTELRISDDKEIDRLIPVRLETLLKLKLNTSKLQCLNNVLKQDLLPNLSELFVSHPFTLGGMQIERKFDPNHTVKLEKLRLRWCTISAEELEILSEKLISIRLTELDLTLSSGFIGNLSALFTHSFPRLNSLKLSFCNLNSEDIQSLARANVEGKLPQLEHLDISGEQTLEISNLFTHSTQWNQLKTLDTTDRNILNVETEFLTSLEKLCLRWYHWDKNTLPPVTRRWSGLKTIQIKSEKGITCVADGVERGMFPDLTTVGLEFSHFSVDKLLLFKLFKANIFVHRKY